MTLGFLALGVLFLSLVYALAWNLGYREGRIDGRLEEQAEQDRESLEATEAVASDHPHQERVSGRNG